MSRNYSLRNEKKLLFDSYSTGNDHNTEFLHLGLHHHLKYALTFRFINKYSLHFSKTHKTVKKNMIESNLNN